MTDLLTRGIHRLRRYTRGRRSQEFRRFIASTHRAAGTLRIVDIGGTVPFWSTWWNVGPEDNIHVTVVNNHEQDETDDQVSALPHVVNWRTDAMTLTPQD